MRVVEYRGKMYEKPKLLSCLCKRKEGQYFLTENGQLKNP